MDSFAGLGLDASLCSAFSSLKIEKPTQVQSLAIPLLLGGRDLFLESETGTGKTYAYLAPAFSRLAAEHSPGAGQNGPRILVAAPTQELATQVGRVAERLGLAAGLEPRTAVLIGGSPLERQAEKLKAKPLIVVGTIGRLADLVSLKRLKTEALDYLVLDEADRLLATEMEDSALALLRAAPPRCARVLVSATLPERFKKRALSFMRDPQSISVEAERPVLAGEIEHWCFYCDGRRRLDFVRRFEAAVKPERCLLFMSVAGRVGHAEEVLSDFGLPVAAIHSQLGKEERHNAIERFSEGKLRYLLTSDLGARGLDIPGISHVISLDLPEDETIYVHRAGRTGRAGARGTSIVLCDSVELRRASKIAVKEGFSFKCKFLEGGKVLEPTTEEFFERADRAEAEKEKSRCSGAAQGRTGHAPHRSESGSIRHAPRGSESGARGHAPRGRRDEGRD